jgi:hypothetical protein
VTLNARRDTPSVSSCRLVSGESVNFLNRPKTLMLSRKVFLKHRESLEQSEVIFNVWRLESPHEPTAMKFATCFYENSIAAMPIVVHGFDEMDAFSKCIREIDLFILISLRQHEVTFEHGFPFTLEKGSAFFGPDVASLSERLLR